MIVPVAVLVFASAITKGVVGWRAAGRIGAGPDGGARAAVALIPRGEMSIVLATLGAGAAADLGPLAVGYVLVLAIAGPVLMRYPAVVERVRAKLLPGVAPGLEI